MFKLKSAYLVGFLLAISIVASSLPSALQPLAAQAENNIPLPPQLTNGGNNAPIAMDDAGRMFAVSPFQATRFEINPLTYALIDDTNSYTMPGFTITGINSLAIHPTTGEIYAIIKLSGVSGRVLGTIDLETGVATMIGNLGANFSNLAFTNGGVLYGVTGDGATPSETLFTIDPVTAVPTLVMALGNGADGETIAFNPDDGLMYHSSGNGTPIWESINLQTLTVTPIVGNLGTGEIFSIRYVGNNTFLTTDIGSSAQFITTAGVITPTGSSLADDYRGMVYAGSTPYHAIEDTPLIVTATDNHLLVNDFDADFDPLTAVLDTVTTGAVVDLDSSGIFTYTPPPDFCGLDTFTYHVNDGLADSPPADVYIEVDCLFDPPLANDDVYTTTEDIPLVIPAAGVLTNDYDPDGPAVFTPTLLIPPAVGALQLNTDGSFSYTPTLNFNGITTFTYQITNTTVITSTPPMAYWPFDDGSNPTSDVSGNGHDGTLVNGPVFTTTVPAKYPGTAIFFDGVDDRIDITGTITLPNNSFTAAFWAKRTAVGAMHTAIGHGSSTTTNNFLHIGFRSTNTFTCAFWNNDLNTTTTYTDDNWHHWACTYNATTNRRTIYRDGVIVASDIATADYQGSGSLTIGSLGTGDIFAGLLDEVRVYNFALSSSEINLLMDANSPPPDSDTATVTLNISSVNDLPLAAAEAYTTTEDIPLVISAPGVLANDSDPVENSSLTAVLDSDVTNGSLSLNSDGSFIYTPTLNFNGTDLFTYQAHDGEDNSEVVTVTLTILPDNDAPLTAVDAYTTTEDIPLIISSVNGVLSNDSDVENDPLTAVLATNVTTGTLDLGNDGSFTYTPAVNWFGVVTFTYQADDGHELSNIVTVTLTVLSENDAPTAEAGANQTAVEGELLTFAGSYSDPGRLHSGGTSIAWAFGDGATATGTLTPTHTFADNGLYTVTLTITDSEGAADSDTLLVTVSNADPTLEPVGNLTITIGTEISFTTGYADAGVLDTHTAEVNWDDGNSEAATVANFLVSGSHTYTSTGVYTVTVTLMDDDGGEATQSFVVTVMEVPASGWRIFLPLVQRGNN